MPRARAHIQNLLDAHQAQIERIAELERLIAEATNPSATPARPQPQAGPSKPQLSADEAIRAEEQALRKLEAKIAPHRQAARAPAAPLPAPRSPSPPPARPLVAQTPARTPAKTPTTIPHIANSLVNGATPHRAAPPTLNRFSPLKLFTPRARLGRSSMAQDETFDGDAQRSIFGRGSILRSSANSSRKPVLTLSPDKPEAAPEEDETVRLGRVTDEEEQEDAGEETVVLESAPASEVVQLEPVVEPAPVEEPPVEAGPRRVEGVDIESPAVIYGAVSIIPLYRRLKLTSGQNLGHAAPNDASGTERRRIRRHGSREHSVSSAFYTYASSDSRKHIHFISQSDPDPPPSPSSASSLSSTSATGPAATKAAPIVPQTILLAQLLMLVLRSEDCAIPYQSAKDALGAMIRARGWDNTQDLETKTVYYGVGNRVLKIDRKGGAGGKVIFAP